MTSLNDHEKLEILCREQNDLMATWESIADVMFPDLSLSRDRVAALNEYAGDVGLGIRRALAAKVAAREPQIDELRKKLGMMHK